MHDRHVALSQAVAGWLAYKCQFYRKLFSAIAESLQHPLFWYADAKLKYLGETVGSVLPVRVKRSEHPFINDLEQIVDQKLGRYNEGLPTEGGSWAASLEPSTHF